jgi:hypothetical protein
MAKNKKHKPKWKKAAPKLRNAASGVKARGIGDSIMEAVERTAASAGGGAASALIGGLAVSHSIMEPETFGLISTVAGAALASRSDTKWREAFNGAAAAGAGQLVLGWMAKRALKANDNKPSEKPDGMTSRPNGKQGALPAPQANAANGEGHVLAMFRDMAGGLDDYFEERARTDERARYPDEPDVVVVQSAA